MQLSKVSRLHRHCFICPRSVGSVKIYSPPCHLQPPPPPFLFSGHNPHVLHTQFMQKKEEGDDVHRSAVTGKVIKMKVRKSSKDKEVCVL